jgi:CheY-like chemotaxis protein
MPLPAKSGKRIILCIEDDMGYLRLRRTVLEQNGYSVLGARTGLEALDLLRRSPIALVISDHLLGNTTGTALAEEIRKIRPLVPIMLYSGMMPEHLGEVNCFMSKTESIDHFLSMVSSLMSR